MEEQFKVILFSTDSEDTYDIASSVAQNPEGWINEGAVGTYEECDAYVTQAIQSPMVGQGQTARMRRKGPMMGQGPMGQGTMGQGMMGQGTMG